MATTKQAASDNRQRTNNVADERVLVLDFGAQYAQLIARRVREQHVYGEIVRHDITAERVRQLAPKGLILSGGPSSVYAPAHPTAIQSYLSLGFRCLEFVTACN